MPSSDTELRGELALSRKAIASLQRAARKEVPDLPHNEVRRLLKPDRA